MIRKQARGLYAFHPLSIPSHNTILAASQQTESFVFVHGEYHTGIIPQAIPTRNRGIRPKDFRLVEPPCRC